MEPDTPDVIQRYFAADAERDIDAIVGLFSLEAIVLDEGETRRGLDEIRAWQLGPASKYTYTTEVTGSQTLGPGHHRITGRLTGNFPGGSADLTWDFTIDADRITHLVIAP